MSAFGLGRQLGLERAAAQAYVDLYFQRYPGVKAFMDRTRRQARAIRATWRRCSARGCICPEINSRNAQRRQYAERSAINAPMQGTAADIIKRAMISIADWLRTLEAATPAPDHAGPRRARARGARRRTPNACAPRSASTCAARRHSTCRSKWMRKRAQIGTRPTEPRPRRINF